MAWTDLVREQLQRMEGTKQHPYLDTVGKTTIGCGRNLTDKGLSEAEIDLLLAHDIADAEEDARHLLSDAVFGALTDTRKAVLVNMAFNLGYKRLAKFSHMLLAVKAGDYRRAAAAMLDSKWATQVGARAQELSRLMERG